jgi:uncharacterized membrane protein YhaH (DUF805 family)
MSFTDAIKTCFRNYLGFSGRAARSEYWYWMLFVILLWIVALLLDLTVLAVFNTTGVPIMILLAILATLLPSVAVSARRLHDLDRSGWWAPLILPAFVWGFMRGTVGANRFGPDPLEGKV